MGSKRRRGDSYELRHKGKYKTWPIPKGMSKSKAENQAQKELAAFEELIEKGINVEKITFQELAGKFLEDKTKELKTKESKPKTIDFYRQNLKRINKSIGSLEVKQIRKAHLREFIAELQEPYIDKNGNEKVLSPTTVVGYFRTISSILSYACELDYIETSPAAGKGIKLPKIPTTNEKGIPIDVLKKYSDLMMEAPLKHKTFFFIALSTGARRGEILGLKWTDVNFEDNSISINDNSQITEDGIIFVSPKTTASARTIALSPEVMQMLKDLKQEERLNQLSMGHVWKHNPEAPEQEYCENHDKCNHKCKGYCSKHCKMFAPTNRVFTQDNGIPMYPKTPYDFLRKLGKKNDLPHITVHQLRHTAISQFIKDGNAITEIASFVGHATPQVTNTVYAHDIREQSKAKTINSDMLSIVKEA